MRHRCKWEPYPCDLTGTFVDICVRCKTLRITEMEPDGSTRITYEPDELDGEDE